MVNTKPLSSQVRYGSGSNTVDKALKKSILLYPDYAAASAAAATLPDGQRVEIEADETRGGRSTRYVVQSGALVFVSNLDQMRVDLTSAGGSALVEHDARTVKEQLDQVTRIENIHALRDFWKAMNAFHTVEDSTLAIASYGDSVSGDVCGALGVYLRSLIGFSNLTTFSIGASYGPLPAPATFTGGANYHEEPLAAGICDYLPTGKYYDIPVGGTALFNASGQDTGFTKITCYLAKKPGGGTALVELLNETLAVISSITIDTSNVDIDATKADFTGLDPNVKYRLRVTASGAPVVGLGIAMLRPRGITQISWGYGGTTLAQQNTSPKKIFDFINNDLGVSLFISECKGEADEPTGYSGLIARLNALTASKLFIGTRPDRSGSTNLDKEVRWTRKAAASAGYAYVDARSILKDYAEVSRLGWGGDGTHIDPKSAYYVAALIFQSIPIGALAKFYATRDTYAGKVIAGEFSVTSPANASVGSRIVFAKTSAGNEPNTVRMYNIRRLHSGPDNSAPSIGVYGSGWAVFSAGDTFGDMHVRAIHMAPGSTSPSTFYQVRATNGIRGGSYAVIDLPSTADTGALAYATNGRKVGEAAGAGTGVPVYRSQGGLWRRLSDDTQVLA